MSSGSKLPGQAGPPPAPSGGEEMDAAGMGGGAGPGAPPMGAPQGAQQGQEDQPAGMNYIGKRISLTSKSEIRYEGTLYQINPRASTVALEHVRSFGSEGRPRPGGPVPPSNEIYSYIVFRAADIKELKFLPAAPARQPAQQVPADPAIVSSGYQPRPYGGMGGGRPGSGPPGALPMQGMPQGGNMGPGAPQYGRGPYGAPGVPRGQPGQQMAPGQQMPAPGQQNVPGQSMSSAGLPQRPTQDEGPNYQRPDLKTDGGRTDQRAARTAMPEPGQMNGTPTQNEQGRNEKPGRGGPAPQGMGPPTRGPPPPSHVGGGAPGVEGNSTRGWGPPPTTGARAAGGRSFRTQAPERPEPLSAWGQTPQPSVSADTSKAPPAAAEVAEAADNNKEKESAEPEQGNNAVPAQKKEPEPSVGGSKPIGRGAWDRGRSVADVVGDTSDRSAQPGPPAAANQTQARTNNSVWRTGAPPGQRSRIVIPKEEYDFEAMNEKFDKVGVAEEGEVQEQIPKFEKKYDAAKSFFDDLVAERSTPESRNRDSEKNMETFGESARRRYNSGRGGRRGGSYRGGMGYRPNNINGGNRNVSGGYRGGRGGYGRKEGWNTREGGQDVAKAGAQK